MNIANSVYFSWLIGVLSIAGIFLLRAKKWQGWIFVILNNAVLFPILNVHNNNYGLLPLDVVTVYLSIGAARKWAASPKGDKS